MNAGAHVNVGTAPPSAPPPGFGATFVDIVGRRIWSSVGVSLVGDWVENSLAGGFLVPSNNLSDLTDASLARTALGLAPISASGSGADLTPATVTYAKIQNVSASARILGRITGGAGSIEELTPTQATSLLNIGTATLAGLAPASGGGTANFLRADWTWAPPGTAGLGDVVGPASATANALAVYSGTTGKLIQDSTITYASSVLTIPNTGYFKWGTFGSLRATADGVFSLLKNDGTTGGVLTAQTFKTSTTGTNALPAYVFSTSNDTGIYSPSQGEIDLALYGVRDFRFLTGGGFQLAQNAAYLSFGTAADLILLRHAANSLALRNGVNAQELRCSNSYVDGSNYSTGLLSWQKFPGELSIGSDKLGGGITGPVRFYVGGTTVLRLDTTSVVPPGFVANARKDFALGLDATDGTCSWRRFQPVQGVRRMAYQQPIASGNVSAFGEGWTELVAGTNVAATSTTSPYRKFSTTTAAANVNGLVCSQSNWWIGRNLYLRFVGKFEQTTDIRAWIGWSNNGINGNLLITDGQIGDCVGFQFSTNRGDVNWQCASRDGTTQSVTNSGVAFDTAVHTFEIVEDTVGAAWIFMIDNVVVATKTTNKPTTATAVNPLYAVATIAGGTARDMDAAYFFVMEAF